MRYAQNCWPSHKVGIGGLPALRTGVKLCSPTTIIGILHYLQAQESSAVRHQRVEKSIRSGVRQAFKSGGAESVMEFETALRGTVAGGVLGWSRRQTHGEQEEEWVPWLLKRKRGSKIQTGTAQRVLCPEWLPEGTRCL